MIHYPEFYSRGCCTSESKELLQRKIKALISTMTQDEKISFCFGGENPAVPGKIANAGYLRGIPRLGIPEIRMYDGPAGTTYIKPTTCLPAQGTMACAWSVDAAYQYGSILGRENAAVSGNCQLGAQFDLMRTSHFERAKDMMGEDPVLLSELAVGISQGISDQGVIPVGKHFVACVRSCCPAFEADFQIDEQTLHQMYLLPFEAAVTRGACTAIMTAYNMLNGRWASESDALNKHILRELWGFQGFTVTDWGANHTFSLSHGIDMEMPGPEHNTPERIKAAIRSGELPASCLDDAAGHILYAMGQAGYLRLVCLDAQGNVLAEEGREEPIRLQNTYDDISDCMLHQHGQAALELSRKSAVLMKNENNFLPLTPEDYSGGNHVAVIGMCAGRLVSGESQERAFGVLDQMESPLAALRRLSGSPEGFSYGKGIDMLGDTIPEQVLYTDAACTQHGLTRTYGISASDGEGPPMFGPGGAGQEYVGGQAETTTPDNSDDAIPIPVGIFQNNAAGVFEGHPLGSFCSIDPEINFTCGTVDGHVNGSYFNSTDGTAFPFGSVYTWRGFLKAPESGNYRLILQCIGGIAGFKISLDAGETWKFAGSTSTREGAHWGWSELMCTDEGMDISGTEFPLEAGQVYPVLIYCNGTIPDKDVQIRAAWITPSMQAQDYQQAQALAATCKKVLVFVHRGSGAAISHMMEPLQELGSLALPEDQEKLLADICRTAETHHNQVGVVMFCSSAFVMGDWADQSDALLDMGLPGQCGGTAAAELLLGQVNPSGKTVLSFPMADADTPVTDTNDHYCARYRGTMTAKRHVQVDFSEGIFIGYRWHDRYAVKPRFCFGHGLSYTSFRYERPSVHTDKTGTYHVCISITNTGTRTGSEIVQVYAGSADVPAYVQMPKKQLVGFARVEDILPRQTVTVDIPLCVRGLQYWDIHAPSTDHDGVRTDQWRMPKGPRKLFIGASAQDIRCETLL